MADDQEAERAVERWVRLGDEVVSGKKGGQRDDTGTCASCGRTFNVITSEKRALCARCFLERGTSRTSE
jgi:protein-arginine kinase activator protein McsA